MKFYPQALIVFIIIIIIIIIHESLFICFVFLGLQSQQIIV